MKTIEAGNLKQGDRVRIPRSKKTWTVDQVTREPSGRFVRLMVWLKADGRLRTERVCSLHEYEVA